VTIGDEMTCALTARHHDTNCVLRPAHDSLQRDQRVVELAALQRLELFVARQLHRSRHATHAHIMRMGV
jgi:hypothetical protein